MSYTMFPDLHKIYHSKEYFEDDKPKKKCNVHLFNRCTESNVDISYCEKLSNCEQKASLKKHSWGLPACDKDEETLNWYKTSYKNCVGSSSGENCCNEITCSNPEVISKSCM